MSPYHNYQKPYFRRRRYKSSSPADLFKGIFALIISLTLLASFSNPALILTPLTRLTPFIVIFLFIYIINKLIKYLSKKPSPKVTPTSIEPTSNAEKHGCKCYMEHLTEGEQNVAEILADQLNYKDYFIFNNLTIPSTHNGSSQIDHLVISKFGIFVIESKDYSGWIYGSERNDQWTVTLHRGYTKIQFENPLRQNWSHIMSLQTLLPTVPKEIFQSIIVFSEKSKFKIDPIPNVVNSEQVIEYIQKFKDVKLTEEQIHLLIGKLTYTCQTADISLEKHIENIQAAHPTLY